MFSFHQLSSSQEPKNNKHQDWTSTDETSLLQLSCHKNSWVATLCIDAQHFFYFRILLINFFIYRVEDSLEKNAEPHRQRKTFEKRLNRSIISL